MEEQVQKQKKKYKRKGQRKEVLFKDDEWEVVKRNAERMGLIRNILLIILTKD